MTKQTSVNAIIGFISINGVYIPSQFRTAYEEGHLFLLDELDAADPNVLLILNTLENGYIAFPDGIVHGHKDFTLIATANPQNEHSIYTGRSKLDFSSIDRYYIIELPRDPSLEKSITSAETAAEIDIARSVLKSQGSSVKATMRDTIRVHKLVTADIDTMESAIEKVIFQADESLYSVYTSQRKVEEAKLAEAAKQAADKAAEDAESQHDVANADQIWKKVQEGK